MSELTYRSAGVDLDLYEQAMQKLPRLMQRTFTPGVMELPGGFAGLFRLNGTKQWKDPVLVSGTDGVGTKIKVAIQAQKYDSIGIDLVGMCVNDVLCLGATPLFFLDYIAMGKDNPLLLEQLVSGVSDGCQQAMSALLGGETAIMPDLYAAGDFDMAGFSVGVAERDELVNGKTRVKPGDVLIGIPSSGFHSNGYSLVRKVVFEHAGLNVSGHVAELNCTVADTLLQPTRIYAQIVAAALEAAGNASLHGIAHITGGGIADNFERILPNHVQAVVSRSAWTIPDVFQWLQRLGNVAENEMFSVFNMGIGMIMCVPPAAADKVQAACSTPEYPAIRLGEIRSQHAETPTVTLV
ncbi:MAG: phosphoribosylformylglycinamidine cyclo-ligase [Planctomycetota bacterium]|nr:phosphoribosylformylglycinamidine cyclo-ligase [Planctomycetales bacterium]RLT03638.1 MAG: phosphoribosylformylglycinamidine cyclo-ligase [Planctomycetota bacterium]